MLNNTGQRLVYTATKRVNQFNRVSQQYNTHLCAPASKHRNTTPPEMAKAFITGRVKTKNGTVLGLLRATCDHIRYFSYLGIPYAEPPIGELRFKAPVPIENWREPLNCLNEPPVPCAFNSTNGIAYDQRSRESCLFLNIYTRHRPHPYPKSRNEQLRPVMVYIYGGAFTYGSIEEAFLRPDFLLRTDIVLVTFNYRIGALGFLSVEDPEAEAPGNAGLKDQALALRWVHDNIANFGGDPERVTAFGQDAGAASVHFHMLSDMSRGLFQRAILQSGTALCQWALRRPQPKRNLPAKLAHRLGWSGDGGVQEMMRVLRDALPSDLVRAQHFASAWDKQTGYQEVFLPVVEPYESETCFLSKAAEELAPLAWGNSIPLLIGCNAEEGKVFYNDWDEEHKMFENADWFVNTLPLNTHTLNERRRYELAALLMQEYYGEVLPTVENRHIFAQLQGDKCFWHGCWKTIRARLAAGASDNTFLYRFSFITLKNRFMAYKAPSMEDGAIHSEELMYLFKQFFINYRLPKEATEVAVIDHMVNIWTSFASLGRPNNQLLLVQWDPVSTMEPLKCMNIDFKLENIDLPEQKRMLIWDYLETAE